MLLKPPDRWNTNIGENGCALPDGVVAEQGSPDEPYNKNGIYRNMVDMQTSSQNRMLG